MPNHETYDYLTDAEAAIVEYFHTRAGARGIPGPVKVKRCFVDISGTGATSFYLYTANGEKCYLASGVNAGRDSVEVFFGHKPSFWPKGRSHQGKWETVK